MLANLLECLDTSLLDIDVYPVDPAGIFHEKFTNCRILRSYFFLRCLTCNYRVEKLHVKITAIFLKAIRYLFKYFLHKDIIHFAEHYVAKKLSNQYDILWACSEDTPGRIAVWIQAATKILWIHNCCNKECINSFAQQGLVDYTAFNKIVCVAQHVAKSLIKNLKEMYDIDVSSRVCVMRNIVNQDEILKLSQEIIEDTRFATNSFTVVSVSRLAWEKRLEVIPEIAANVMAAGKQLRWYLIGDGTPVMWQILKDAIDKWNVAQDVILLGVKKNPYPYIVHADVLALTSRMEAYPTVLNEALALGTYVMVADINGMSEIVPSERGDILSIEEMSKRLIELISKKENSTSVRISPMSFSKHNDEIIEKFMKIVRG